MGKRRGSSGRRFIYIHLVSSTRTGASNFYNLHRSLGQQERSDTLKIQAAFLKIQGMILAS